MAVRGVRSNRMSQPSPQVGVIASERWSIYSEQSMKDKLLLGMAELKASNGEEECKHKWDEDNKVILDCATRCSDCKNFRPAGEEVFECSLCQEIKCNDCYWTDALEVNFTGVMSEKDPAANFRFSHELPPQVNIVVSQYPLSLPVGGEKSTKAPFLPGAESTPTSPTASVGFLISENPKVGFEPSENWSIFEASPVEMSPTASFSMRQKAVPELEEQCEHQFVESVVAENSQCKTCGSWQSKGKKAFECTICQELRCFDCYWMESMDDAFLGGMSDPGSPYDFDQDGSASPVPGVESQYTINIETPAAPSQMPQVGFLMSEQPPLVEIAMSENFSIYSGDVSPRGDPETPAIPEQVLEHEWEEVTLGASAQCIECGSWQRTGTKAFECKFSGQVLCFDCHWMDNLDDAFMGVMSEQQEARASAYAFSPMSFWPAKTNGVTEPKERRNSDGQIKKEKSIKSIERLGSKSSAGSFTSGKHCKMCGQPFKGFGDTCKDCRNNPQGSVTQCKGCGVFFSGYGSRCQDCRTEEDSMAGSASAPANFLHGP